MPWCQARTPSGEWVWSRSGSPRATRLGMNPEGLGLTGSDWIRAALARSVQEGVRSVPRGHIARTASEHLTSLPPSLEIPCRKNIPCIYVRPSWVDDLPWTKNGAQHVAGPRIQHQLLHRVCAPVRHRIPKRTAGATPCCVDFRSILQILPFRPDIVVHRVRSILLPFTP